MKEMTLYTCEFCYTDYRDIEYAKACEKSHIKPISIEKSTDYHTEINQLYPLSEQGDLENYPTTLYIKFENNKTAIYKLDDIIL